MLKLIPVTLLLAAVASAQVTVTASRSSNLPPDQVIFGVTVSSGLDATLDSIIAAVQGTGITPTNFASLNSAEAVNRLGMPDPTTGLTLQWGFSLPVALPDLKTTTSTLTAAQSKLTTNQSGLTLSFAIGGTQVSTQAQQSQSCAPADLMADARTKAQTRAAAGGLSLGSILAVSAASTATGTTVGIIPISTYLPICTVAVRFGTPGGISLPGDNTLTISASRSITFQPDQAVIGVGVTAPLTSTLNDVLGTFPDLGLTAANLSAVYNQSYGDPSLNQWTFNLTVPMSNLKTVLTSLVQIQKNTAKGPLIGSFYVDGLQVSQSLQASEPCSQSALVNDATAQGRKLASAAGLTLGPVIGVSDGTAVNTPGSPEAGSYFAVAYLVGLPTQFVTPQIAPTTCSATVRFKLGS